MHNDHARAPRGRPWRAAPPATGLRTRLSPLVLAAALAAAGAAQGAGAAPASLYDRLGGAVGVASVVDRLIERTAADPRTRRSFEGIKLKAIKDSLAQQICSITGGGCRYEGETMARAHAQADIRASEFDAMVALLREELDRAGVDAGAKNELLRLLAPMKRDVLAGAAAASAPAR